ncbi:MAG: beta strand repeat-containing protein, partial [Chthoniobacterales bacterium]
MSYSLRLKSCFFHVVLLCGVAGMLPRAESASNLYWIGGDGTWDTTELDWTLDSGLLPPFQAWDNLALDTAFFTGTAGTVSLSEPITATGLSFGTDGYIVSGNTLTLNASTTIDSSTGTQTISSVIAGAATGLTKTGAGTIVLSGANTYIGATTISGGTLSVKGSGASIGVASASASTMSVGSAADATLRIENGGSVKNTSATLGGASGTTGSVVVDGAGSLWNPANTSGTTLSIVSGGNGSLSVLNGGAVTMTRSSTFSPTATHTASFTVDGVGSTYAASSVSFAGAGTMTGMISGGGVVSTTNGTIGASGGGGAATATVTGAGSRWNLSSTMTVDGTGVLNVLNGGNVTTGAFIDIGETTGVTSTVNVGGNSATLATANSALVVGDAGYGTLNVNAGGIVNAGYNLRLGNNAASKGIVNQNGGTVNIHNAYLEFNLGTPEYHLLGGTLSVNDVSGAGIVLGSPTSYLFELGGGTLQVNGGTESSLTIYPNATLKTGTTSTLDVPAGGFQLMYWESVLSGSGNLKVTGPGTVVLDKANTYTGSTTIAGGTLRYGINNALSTSTNIIFNGGMLEFGSSTVPALTAGTGGRQIQWLGDGGFSSYNGNRTVSYLSGAQVTWG